MKTILKMAYRNLGRNRRRTVLTGAAVAAVVMIIIFLQCYTTGILGSMFDNGARFTTGHVKIEAQGYADREALFPLDLMVAESSEVEKSVSEVPGVVTVVRRLKFLTMVQRGDSDEFPVVMGLEAAKERKVMELDRSVVRGRYLGDGPREALIGYGLARKLGVVDEHDQFRPEAAKVQILAPRGIPMTFTVVGVFRLGFSLIDDKVMAVNLRDAQYAADLDLDDMVSEIVVMLDHRDRSLSLLGPITAAANRVSGAGPLEVLPWQAQGFLYQAVQSMAGVIVLVIGILFFISASTIVNTMLMAVMERTRELGMLMSLGLRGREIVGLILLEGLAVGAVSGLVGAVLGGVLSLVLSHTGIPVGDATANLPVPMGDTIQVTFVWWSIPLAYLFGLVMSAGSALWPAMKAARLDPTRALRTI